MLNLIQKIIEAKAKQPKKAYISDSNTDFVKSPDKHAQCRRVACDFADLFVEEIRAIGKVSELLTSPRVEYNQSKHMKLTMPKISYLEEFGVLNIIFDLNECEPIDAYFSDEDKKARH